MRLEEADRTTWAYIVELRGKELFRETFPVNEDLIGNIKSRWALLAEQVQEKLLEAQL